MEAGTIIFVVIGVFIGAFVVWIVTAKQGKPAVETDSLLLIQNQLATLAKTMDDKLGASNKDMQEAVRHQFVESQSLIRDITEKLTRLDETNKQVISVTDQLQGLQDILKNPKQRGVLGEYYLETLLKNVMPPGSYQMQYHLGVSEEGKELIPDAVVFVKDKIIPIDSKFSLENYNRMVETTNTVEKQKLAKLFEANLKERIVETAKYIQPSKGTMDFAFMFIPHEAIYYDLLVGKVGATENTEENLIQRAAGKYKVIIVSPTSFLAYLQTVLQGLKAMEIEEKAKDIVKRVEELGKHLKSYEKSHGSLGNTLQTAINHYNTSSKELKKVDKDVLRITGMSPGLEVPILEGPDREDE